MRNVSKYIPKQMRLQPLSENVGTERRVSEVVRQRVPGHRTGDGERPTAIPGSSIPCERMFSVAGMVSDLHPKFSPDSTAELLNSDMLATSIVLLRLLFSNITWLKTNHHLLLCSLWKVTQECRCLGSRQRFVLQLFRCVAATCTN